MNSCKHGPFGSTLYGCLQCKNEAAMTNQNDTQDVNMDEAERFATERIDSWNRQFYDKYMAPGQSFQYLRADIISLLAESYRAGVASVDTREIQNSMRKHYEKMFQDHNDNHDRELTASRAEVERLRNCFDECMKNRDSAITERDAEKAHNKKLVECLEDFIILADNHNDSSFYHLLEKTKLKALDVISAYSTDSGDGEKG